MKLKLGTALLAATALAFAFGTQTARADYIGGDAPKMAKQCYAYTDFVGHGYWRACPKPAKVAKGKKGKKKGKKGKKGKKK
jgi:hypothetical protein